jgi:hypothetical protein
MNVFVHHLILGALSMAWAASAAIPLPEHPRPDFERPDWQNLNGPWQFRFDAAQVGEAQQWFSHGAAFEQVIQVPFPWGSELSGVTDGADVGWYSRVIQVPEAWRGKRVFVVVGASDWLTRGWLDGHDVGRHQGGYTPFAFELTPQVRWGEPQSLVLRVDDTPHKFKLEGKQGYGPARGVWQTVYLEARGQTFLTQVRCEPDPDREQVVVRLGWSGPVPDKGAVSLTVRSAAEPAPTPVVRSLTAGATNLVITLPLPGARRWTLEDPFLYELVAALRSASGAEEDVVSTYFGMRKIGVVNLPGTEHPYIALNDRPLYLQMALDQAYHPQGFYTFPSDEFMRDEILRSRRIGLNAMRVHVKIEIPRKLYWADRLGMLIMADVPNSWGFPDADMRRETEFALEGMIERDFNHPSIFSWVIFNETWGLKSADGKFAAETQDWVASLYRRAKALDPTRLVEDNSPCNFDHVETDINSWHVYLPGYAWKEHLAQVVRDTHPGSTWNFIGGRKQGRQPLLNSECGNVWGYEGSAGDVDWSWDYHIMMNEFRRQPKICGWLYTEHHDVINEWNGYYRFDRSEKQTGLDEIMPGMTLNDLHGAFYLSVGSELCHDVRPGASVKVPLYASFMTDRCGSRALTLKTELYGWDTLGQFEVYSRAQRPMGFVPWLSQTLSPLSVRMPEKPALAILGLRLEDATGRVLHRNFCTFRVGNGETGRDETLRRDGAVLRVVRFSPSSFNQAEWSLRQWNVLEGLKVNGAGSGAFEYTVPWPDGLRMEDVEGCVFRAELSAKQLFGKDRPDAGKQEGDYMRGKGTFDPSLNPNAYPMTDTVPFPSAVRVRVAGDTVGVFDLPDDAADHRGILSWHAQPQDRKLREAGSFGWLVEADIPAATLRKAAASGALVLRLEVDPGLPGGLAIYGERFGRYPVDPSFSFTLKRK